MCCAGRALRSCGRVLRCERVRQVRLRRWVNGSCSLNPLLRRERCAPVRRVLRVLCAALVYLVELYDFHAQRLQRAARAECCTGALRLLRGSEPVRGRGRVQLHLVFPRGLFASFHGVWRGGPTVSQPLRPTSTTSVLASDRRSVLSAARGPCAHVRR